MLHIEARREKDLPPEFEYRREDRSLFLDVELPLPPDATGSGAAGEMKRGVLELRIPKASSAPETSIPIDEA
jgi:HSP20 family molecular chaperone IbpA